MEDIALVVFDLAGTTVQDTGQIPDAFTKALQKHDLTVTQDDLRAVRGASKREAIRQLVERQRPEALARTEQVYQAFRERLRETFTRDGVPAIPGASETFAWLRDRKIKVALNTGFDRDITGLLLRALGWDKGVADAVVCGDDVPQGRPAPYMIFRAMEAAGIHSVHRIVNVGDTALDLQAGHNAGVRVNVGVLSGAHTKDLLERAPHTHLIASVVALPDLLK